jgi:DNA sulfur modification protein DndD
MKFKSITLENFGPYFEENFVELSTNPTSPIILFHGENHRGKTTFLRSFRWGLYGNAIDRDGNRIQDITFVNDDKVRLASPFRTSVKIIIENGEEELTLQRWLQIETQSETGKPIITSTGVSLYSTLEDSIPSENISGKINQLLHEDLAGFFLFDTEDLALFQSRLMKINSGEFIKASIEKSLGLPALKTVIDDLKFHENLINADMKESLRDEKAAKFLQTSLRNYQKEKLDLERELKRIQDSRAIALEIKTKHEDTIKANYTLKQKLEAQNSLEEEVGRISRKNSDIMLDIQKRLENKFWLPLHSLVQNTIDEIEGKIDELNIKRNDFLKSEVNRDEITEILSTDVCTKCGENVSESKKIELTNKLELIKKNIETTINNEESLNSLITRKKMIKQLGNSQSEFERVVELDKDYTSNLLELENKKSELKDLKDTLKLLNTEEFTDIEKLFQRAQLEILRYDEEIPRFENNILTKENLVKQTESELAKLQPDGTPIKIKYDEIKLQIAIFETAINMYIHAMKEQVELSASNIFKVVTSEPDFEGLKISGNYSMTIMDVNQNIVPIRSEGDEQIVAMSLIGSLIENSVNSAPVVIDTPLGKLDTIHRDKLLEWLPKMAPQILIFGTSTEITPIERKILGNSVGREYWIKRIKLKRSEISKVGYDK